MSDNPALDAGRLLKCYMEDGEPTELHSLLLHILDRLNKLEEQDLILHNRYVHMYQERHS